MQFTKCIFQLIECFTRRLLHFIVNVLFFCGAKLSIINNLMGIFNFNFYEIYNQRVDLLVID
jgi:hypothetical protein